MADVPTGITLTKKPPPGVQLTKTPPTPSAGSPKLEPGVTTRDVNGKTEIWTGAGTWRPETPREHLLKGAKADMPEWLRPVSDPVMNVMSAITSPGPALAQGMTLGLSDEASGAGGAAASVLKDVTHLRTPDLAKAGQAYTEAKQGELADVAQGPPGSELIGSLAAGGPARSAVTAAAPQALSWLQRLWQGSKIGAAYGGVSGAGHAEGDVVDRATAAAEGAGAGAAAGGTLATALPAAVGGVRGLVNLFLGSSGLPERAAAAETAGITPNLLSVGGSKPAGWLAQFLRSTPIIGSHMVEPAIETAVQQGQGAVARTAAQLGAATTAREAGTAASEGLTSFAGREGPSRAGLPAADVARMPTSATNFTQKAGALYDVADAMMPPGQTYALGNTQRVLRGLTQPFRSSPEMSAAFGNTRAGQMLAALEANPNMAYEDIKAMRTRIGEGYKNPELFPGIGRQELDQLYGALSDDMTRAAQSVSPQAAKAMDNATKYYAAGRDQFRKLGGLTGATTPEATYARLMQAATSKAGKGDVNMLRAARRSMSPEAWGEVSSGVLSELGVETAGAGTATTRQFSPTTFSTSYRNLSDDAKNLFFGMQGSPTRATVENLATVFGNQKAMAKLANTSNTANVTNAGLWPVALFTGGGVGVAKGAAAAALAAKALKSPAFLRWMTTASRARTAQEVAGQVARLQMVAKEAGWGAGELAALQQVYSPYAQQQGQQPPPKTPTPR